MIEAEIRHSLGAMPLEIAFEASGGVTALFGPSGAGKTSVIQAIAGLLRPNEGRIRLGERLVFDSATRTDLAPHKRGVGYVFQDARLFPHLSVAQNLRFGRWFRGGRGKRESQVVDLLGIGPLLARRPGALSGGERQRVAIGRALLSGAEILLMDEPLAALDAPRKAEILPYLQRLKAEAGIPILYVSHSPSEIAAMADQVVALAKGRVVRQGPAAEVLSDPAIVPMLGPRQAGALLEAEVAGSEESGLTRLRFAGGTLLVPGIPAPGGTRLTLRIEARDVLVSRRPPEGIAAQNILPATLENIALGQGPGAMLRLRIGEAHILARMSRSSVESLGLREGDRCHAILKATAIAPADITTTALS